MNPMLAPSVAPSAGSIGRTPAACETAMAIGTIMFAAAVFDVASDSTIATPVKIIVNYGRSRWTLDLDRSEEIVTELISAGVEGKKRGRPPKAPVA